VSYGPTPAEQKSLQFRRSLYVVQDIEAGTRLSAANIRAIRPGLGLSPKFTEQVIGRAVARAVKRGTPVSWDLFA
jgi:N-acetylneuraminate synthase